MIAQRLAKLAVARARLQHAIATASACGDYEYCREARQRFDTIDRRLESLKRVVSKEVLREAKEITNATI